LYFFPLPHGQGALRPTFPVVDAAGLVADCALRSTVALNIS
jgi:hypothetical protein